MLIRDRLDTVLGQIYNIPVVHGKILPLLMYQLFGFNNAYLPQDYPMFKELLRENILKIRNYFI